MNVPIRLGQLADPIRRRLYRALAKRDLERERGSVIVDWACEALEAGWDSTALAILAGLDKPPNEFELDGYLAKALELLHLEWPDQEALVLISAIITAEGVVSGDVSPQAGCKELSSLYWDLGHPAELRPFYELQLSLELAEEGLGGAVADVIKTILPEAQRLLDLAPR
jgi:hypothetical protein